METKSVTVVDRQLLVRTPSETVVLNMQGQSREFSADNAEDIEVIALDDDAIPAPSSWSAARVEP